MYSNFKYGIIDLFENTNKSKNTKELPLMSFSKHPHLLLSTAVLTIGTGSCFLLQDHASADEAQPVVETTTTTDWVEPKMDAKTKADTDWVMSQLATQNSATTQENGAAILNEVVQSDTLQTETNQVVSQSNGVGVNQQSVSNEAVYTEPQSTTTQAYANGLRQFEAASDVDDEAQKQATIQQLAPESEKLLAQNSYKCRLDPDQDQTTYDINQLPQKVREEMTTYAVGLINQLRDAMGVTRAHANRDMVKLAQEVAHEYLQSGFTAGDTRGHYEAGIKKVAERHHLMSGQYYENLNTEHEHDASSQLVTRKDLRESTHNAIMTFLYNGYEYDHAVSIAGINFAKGTGGLREFGLAFSQAGNKRRIHLLGLNEMLMLDGSDIRLDHHIDPDEYRGTVAHPKKAHGQDHATQVAQNNHQDSTQNSSDERYISHVQDGDYRIINTHWGDVTQLNKTNDAATVKQTPTKNDVTNQKDSTSDQTATKVTSDPVMPTATPVLAGLPKTGDQAERTIAGGLLAMLVGLLGFEIVSQTKREKKRQKHHSS